MRQATTTGSILLLCMAITSSLIGIAFLFLRSMQMQKDSSRAMQAQAFSNSACKTGMQHAVRTLIESYASSASSGGSSLAATTLNEGWRTTFRPFSAYDRNAPDDLDDLRTDEALCDVYCTWSGVYGASPYNRLGSYTGGFTYLEPRARWIEPGFAPTIRFTNTAATPASADETVFLDQNFVRLAGGSRDGARFRLRYACSIMDLEGVLLGNAASEYDYRRLWSLERSRRNGGSADPDLASSVANVAATNPDDPRWSDPNDVAGLGAQEAHMQSIRRHSWGLFNLTSCVFATGNAVDSCRQEHVWLGRGYASNSARKPDAQWGGFPATFSQMYRSDTYQSGQHGRSPGVPARLLLGNRTYYSSNYMLPAQVPGQMFQNPLGGDVFRFDSGSNPENGVVSHNWLGPQLSPVNLLHAANGLGTANEANGEAFAPWVLSPYGHGVRSEATLAAKAGVNSLEWTARDMGSTWYRDLIGPIDTPWRVNVLTAPPRVIHAMLYALLPAYTKTTRYTQERFWLDTGTKDANGRVIYALAAEPINTIDVSKSTSGRDLQIPYVAKAFSDAGYINPVAPRIDGATSANQVSMQPNDREPDPWLAYPSQDGYDAAKYRPDLRYPGKLTTGRYSVKDEGEDDLGELIDASKQAVPFSPVSDCTVMPVSAGQWFIDEITWRNMGTGRTTPDGWGTATDGLNHSVEWLADPSMFKFLHSYWWDLHRASLYAICFMQGQWKGSTDGIITASTFPGGPNPSAYDSIAELDAFFLRQIGENPVASAVAGELPSPAAPAALQAYVFTRASGGGDHKYTAFTPVHNISTLTPQLKSTDPTTRGMSGTTYLLAKNLTIAPTDGYALFAYNRSRVMERMLNDWRMSLFGASPQYAAVFMPYDFNGDDLVECTAFPKQATVAVPASWTAASTTWKPASLSGHILTRAQVEAGVWRSTANWFCLTGTFYVGKSNFYRVLTRGELYDNLLGKPVSSSILETIVQVDANRDMWTSAGALSGTGGTLDTQILFQRWHSVGSRANLPAPYP